MIKVFLLAIVFVQSFMAYAYAPEQDFKILIKDYFSNQKIPNLPLLEKLQGGVFLTIVKGPETLACLGHLEPSQANIKLEFWKVLASMRAQAHLYQRLDLSEYQQWIYWIRIPQSRKRIYQVGAIHLAEDGVLLKSQAKAAIVLPGEAKSHRYLLRLLRSKAGIKKGDPYILYKISTETYRVSFK